MNLVKLLNLVSLVRIYTDPFRLYMKDFGSFRVSFQEHQHKRHLERVYMCVVV